LQAQPSKEKPRLAVVDFQIKVEQAQKALGTAMSDLLIDALVETRRYFIVERSVLQAIRQEQIMALSGEVDAATGAEVGKLVGAEYLVVGVVSKFEENTGGGALGGLVKSKALGGVGWYTSELGITVRIINATTGEIVASEKINQKESAIGLVAVTATQTGAAGGGLYKSKSMQTAMEKAIVRAVEMIGEQIPGGEEAAAADSTGATVIAVTAKNLDFATSRLFAKTLEKIEGVQDVKSAFEGKTANIKVKYRGASEDFADALLATEMPGFKLKVESLAPKKIVMKIDK
jgi:curli biogenesis system outer membrane secretion channel CsgG